MKSLFSSVKRLLNAEFIRFLLTGGLNTLVGYLIYAGSYWLFRHEGVALIIDYTIGAVFNYASYSKLVFNGYRTKRFLIFIAVYVLTYFLNYGLVAMIMRIFDINAYFAQACALTICPLILYFLLKKFVFTNEPALADNAAHEEK